MHNIDLSEEAIKIAEAEFKWMVTGKME